ncbi:MAG: 30S ribosomal protein S16, partial [Verrucomicrobiales bacterium]|nr:30S ribosomal protein S16 [Verrucomicrobiales bacterium]
FAIPRIMTPEELAESKAKAEAAKAAKAEKTAEAARLAAEKNA